MGQPGSVDETHSRRGGTCVWRPLPTARHHPWKKNSTRFRQTWNLNQSDLIRVIVLPGVGGVWGLQISIDLQNSPSRLSILVLASLAAFHSLPARRSVQDPFKIPSRSVQDPSKIRSRSVQDPFKIPFKIRSKSVQDLFKIRSRFRSKSVQNPFKITSRSVQDPLNTLSKSTQNPLKTLSTSYKNPIKTV